MSEIPPSRDLKEGFDALRTSAQRAALPGDSYGRLVEKIERRKRRTRQLRRWLLVATPALAGLVVLVVLAVWRLPGHRQVAGFEIVDLHSGAEASPTTDGELAVTGPATLRVPVAAATITVPKRARMRREARGVRLLRGRARFSVTPRPASVAFFVLVSHGRIEVVGTRFDVEQGVAGGEVLLETGRILFVAHDGRERLLAAGEGLRWPLPAPATRPASSLPPLREEPPASAPASPRRPRPSRPEPRRRARTAEVRRYLTEIDALRIRRDYPTLAKRLGEVLAAGVDEPLRERLSVELSDVLTRHGNNRVRACRHLTAHLRRYPRGRNRQDLLRSAAELECAGFHAPASKRR